jgi:Fe-S cluster biogenesis protein NfuA
MYIETESTPNPLTLKFMPGIAVMGQGTAFFTSADAAKKSPLALDLFTIKDVTAVFLGSDFITITRAESADWELLKPSILTSITEHFVAGRKVIEDAKPTGISADDDSDIVKQIKELIETRVRPAVAQDGGDIIYKSFKDGIVQLELHGSCSGCPSSTATLKQGIESMLKHYVPEVIAVEAVA